MSDAVPTPPAGDPTPGPDGTQPLVTAAPDSAPPAPEQPRKRGAGKMIGGVLLVIVMAVAGVALSRVIFNDNAGDAKAGDCISAKSKVKDEGTTKTGARVVDCGSGDAQFTVVARVDGETSLQSPACEKFFQPEEKFYVMASQDGQGYLLCMRPKA
ncbi:LppU/SCO3897 family protein [Actinoplanes solisilvae]|uniref:LppU/SCO3897 family protein n=1 Tax=Actinoplanes solisilvae TaxID=2486853 RepID=UPI000FD978C2|nr:hypothetical protein [Actinoplanes solisilvae]